MVFTKRSTQKQVIFIEVLRVLFIRIEKYILKRDVYGEKFNKPKNRFREIKEYKPKKYTHTHMYDVHVQIHTRTYVYYNACLSARDVRETFLKSSRKNNPNPR